MILTDLDGTLLEPDGTLAPPAREALTLLRARGIPVIPLTSKTRLEARRWIDELGSAEWGAFENGAGILGPSGTEILPGAVPVRRLARVLREIAPHLRFPAVAITDLPDAELAALTGLAPESLAPVRAREYDYPFVAPEQGEDELVTALRVYPDVRLTRGDRFWHLTGRHDKGEAAQRILEHLGVGTPSTIGFGDSANDAPFLLMVERPVIVPRSRGPDPRLVALLPHALVATAPAGAGWAEAALRLLGAEAA